MLLGGSQRDDIGSIYINIELMTVVFHNTIFSNTVQVCCGVVAKSSNICWGKSTLSM